MNKIVLYLVEIVVTLVVCSAVAAYLSRSLRRVLVDLCGTEERAQFWLVFSSILLVGLPLIFSLGYNPQAADTEMAFFEIANQIKWDLLGFLVTLMGVGAVISFFALVAPRPAANKNVGG